jgi:hypothetical protein
MSWLCPKCRKEWPDGLELRTPRTCRTCSAKAVAWRVAWFAGCFLFGWATRVFIVDRKPPAPWWVLPLVLSVTLIAVGLTRFFFFYRKED